MTKTAFSSEIFSAATLHLGVLDDFIAVVEAKLAETVNPFARDSLGDLLVSLMEQRETYLSDARRTAHVTAAHPAAAHPAAAHPAAARPAAAHPAAIAA